MKYRNAQANGLQPNAAGRIEFTPLNAAGSYHGADRVAAAASRRVLGRSQQLGPPFSSGCVERGRHGALQGLLNGKCARRALAVCSRARSIYRQPIGDNRVAALSIGFGRHQPDQAGCFADLAAEECDLPETPPKHFGQVCGRIAE